MHPSQLITVSGQSRQSRIDSGGSLSRSHQRCMCSGSVAAAATASRVAVCIVAYAQPASFAISCIGLPAARCSRTQSRSRHFPLRFWSCWKRGRQNLRSHASTVLTSHPARAAICPAVIPSARLARIQAASCHGTFLATLGLIRGLSRLTIPRAALATSWSTVIAYTPAGSAWRP